MKYAIISDIHGNLPALELVMKDAKENNIDADYFLGIESGITNLLGKWIIINVAVIKNKNGYEK